MLSIFRLSDLEFPNVWEIARGWMDGARVAFGKKEKKKKELARHAQDFPESFRGLKGISPSTSRSPW